MHLRVFTKGVHVSCFVSMNVSAEQNILTLSKASCCAEWLFIVFFMCMSNCSTALTECIKMFSIAEMVSLCGNIAEGINVLELVFKTCILLIIFESTICASARAGLLCTKNRTSWSTKCGWSETKCMFLLKSCSNKSFYRLWHMMMCWEWIAKRSKSDHSKIPESANTTVGTPEVAIKDN